MLPFKSVNLWAGNLLLFLTGRLDFRIEISVPCNLHFIMKMNGSRKEHFNTIHCSSHVYFMWSITLRTFFKLMEK